MPTMCLCIVSQVSLGPELFDYKDTLLELVHNVSLHRLSEIIRDVSETDVRDDSPLPPHHSCCLYKLVLGTINQ